MTRICIIGAGPSGMSVAHHIARIRREKPQVSIDFVIYEKQSDCGGLWNYSWRTGTDENGEPVHNSMYRNLWSNGPKEASLEYPDYTFIQHFGKPIGSFPPRAVLLDYLLSRFRLSDSRSNIRFNCAVRSVTFDPRSRQFTVLAKDLAEDKLLPEENFDFFINCAGHFSVPNVPQFAGIETFRGRIMHSHDFRNAEEFSGKRIVLVGASYSAEDLAMQTVKFGAKSAICSYRSKPMNFKWPKGIEERPLIANISENLVNFIDGSSAECDAIILCTGYQHHYPYLPDNLRLKGPNELYPPNLYKGTVWTLGGDGRMLYIGVQDQYYTFTMFDAQARWAVKYIIGDIVLPAAADVMLSIEQWRLRQSKLSDCHDDIDFQSDFVQTLCSESEYGADLDIGYIFHDWERNKMQDIATYRDKSHPSKYSGTTTPQHHTRWLLAMDESYKAFMADDAAAL